MSPYRVLLIAPYPELAEVAVATAGDFPELELTVHEGDLHEGLEAALGVFGTDFDAVISRGGTAQMLEDEITVPVFEVGVSGADLLAALALHNPLGKRTAVVGFSNALESVSQVADFSDFDLDVFEVSFEDELPLILQEVQAGSYEVVLCDNFAVEKCRALGIDAHLLQSGARSVHRALAQALFFCQQVDALQQKNHVLWDLLKSQPFSFALFSPTGRLMYSDLGEDRNDLLPYLRQHLNDTAPAKLVLRRGRRIHRINLTRTGKGENLVVSFSVSTSNAPAGESLVGIERMNADEVERTYRENIYGITGAGEEIAPLVAKAAAIQKPLMLEGEIGVGKAQIAALLYLNGNNSNHPFVVIDCSLLIEKSWDYLMNSPSSPLYATGDTIYFKAAQALDAEHVSRLLDVIRRSNAAQRDRVIFSANDDPRGGETDAVARIVEYLHCHVLTAPPLRERRDLRRVIFEYLKSEAERTGSEAPALSDEATALLCAHTWKRNYIELRQVLQHCMNTAPAGFVDAALAREAIERERASKFSSLSTPDSATSIDLLRPLKDTERQIVQMVVDKLGGNQTEAARVLGLSRTTVWRMLK
ncbi:MAG: PrpR N-terminal domain-containing protein [Coriobacteriia bacterium]|nr:PrpR N-terminal domain-containing protein [Coriobacteriia bacterium]